MKGISDFQRDAYGQLLRNAMRYTHPCVSAIKYQSEKHLIFDMLNAWLALADRVQFCNFNFFFSYELLKVGTVHSTGPDTCIHQ